MRRAKANLKQNTPAGEAIFDFSKAWLRSRLAFPQGQELKKAQSGQVILEYILLLVISVTIATFLTKQLVSRNEDNKGLITSTWNSLNIAIAQDKLE